ncbi:MAG: imidazole glycerol phosphate synthase subunit HisH [Nitrospiria bacterium]
MIAIIDYGSGNLRSVQKAFAKVGLEAVVTSRADDLFNASHLVLPGVGAFADCIEKLRSSGLTAALLKSIEAGKPFLGICVGFQVLFSVGEEFGTHPGLNVISGTVKRFPATSLKVPHIGWNQVNVVSANCPLFKGIPDGAHFYFDHSYIGIPENGSDTSSWTEHGIRFTSSIWRNNIFACQFHPEKSQAAGLRFLQNFGGIK